MLDHQDDVLSHCINLYLNIAVYLCARDCVAWYELGLVPRPGERNRPLNDLTRSREWYWGKAYNYIAAPTAQPHPTHTMSDIELLPSDSALSETDSSEYPSDIELYGEPDINTQLAEAQRQWEESLAQLAKALNWVILPLLGKFLGRRTARSIWRAVANRLSAA
ncbi:Mim2 protein [Maudiozyma humilis]|uniref:Mim2 protein n=1 Tax=Maudiozyma humilis TaxID=51915 RepID=A0AAV5RWP3_MAUHU|nr:Mim2 protein [Kazachstania humilis]